MQIGSLTGPQKVTALVIFVGIFAIIVFVISASFAQPAAAPAVKSGLLQPLSTESEPASASSAEVASIPAQTSVSPAQIAVKPRATDSGSAKKIDAWNLGNAKSPTPQLPLNKVIRDYEVIEIAQQPAAKVGETVSLPLLNGKKILVDVQATTINPNGDRSWSGHLQGYGEDYPIVMTYGENAIFAMITTPEGSYTMESIDGVGWLYKNPSELELSDASNKDFLEIPHEL